MHKDIYDEFLEKFVAKTKAIKLGDPFDKGTHMGAIIDQDQLNTIDGYVKSAIAEGATILTGGKVATVEGFEKASGMNQLLLQT